MSTGKKTLLVLAGIALVLVVGAFSAFMILLRDEPAPPDDSDLVLVRPVLAADQNAWTYYAQAGEKRNLPRWDEDSKWPPAPAASGGKPPEGAAKPEEAESPSKIRDRWEAIVNNTAWEQPLVDEVLARNAAALALWEKALAAPECLVPESKDVMQDNSWAFPPVDLGQLVTVRARNYARQGNDEAAMEDAMRLVRSGHQIQGGKGELLVYVVGIGVKGMGCDLMRELAPKSRLAPDRLRRYAAELARYEADPQVFADAMRGEYRLWQRTSDMLGSGATRIGGPPAGRLKQRVTDGLERTFFKPNRTRRLMAEACREIIAMAPRHFVDAPRPDKFLNAARAEQGFVASNYMGGKLLEISIPSLFLGPAYKCDTNVWAAAARVILAMEAFKLEKGRLPASLNELVPDYLDAVPLDDFDGKPFRYNAAKKLIYSVGEDLKDDGGTTKQEFLNATMKERDIDPKAATPEELKDIGSDYPWKAPDLSFPIDF